MEVSYRSLSTLCVSLFINVTRPGVTVEVSYRSLSTLCVKPVYQCHKVRDHCGGKLP